MTPLVRLAVLLPLVGALTGGTPSTGTAGRVPAVPAPVKAVVHDVAVDTAARADTLRYWTARRMRHARPLAPARPLGRAATLLRRMSLGAAAGVAAAAARPSPAPQVGRHAPAVDDPLHGGRPLTVPATGPVSLLLPTPAQPAWRPPTSPPRLGVRGERWPGGGLVAQTTGRVFFTIRGIDYYCSASTVSSANRDVVATAGHCVQDATGTWASRWTFVPGYADGTGPFGRYTARRMVVASAWSRQADDDYDIAMVVLNPVDGIHVVDRVGGEGIAFDRPRSRQSYAFGYPTDPPYDGGSLVYCSGRLSPDREHTSTDQGLRCDMTAGASGGPWLSGFDPATGVGTITSITSFRYTDNSTIMYGPYLGRIARLLFEKAQHL